MLALPIGETERRLRSLVAECGDAGALIAATQGIVDFGNLALAGLDVLTGEDVAWPEAARILLALGGEAAETGRRLDNACAPLAAAWRSVADEWTAASGMAAADGPSPLQLRLRRARRDWRRLVEIALAAQRAIGAGHHPVHHSPTR